MDKKVVIIGAGIAGLSAGCYARMNGYDVEIHESHTQPGGLCTAWKRGDYVLDGCIHWLTGSRRGDELYRVYEELGAVQGRRMFDHDIFSSMVMRDGRALHWYTDIDRLEAHLNELAPRDAKPIEELCAQTRRMSNFTFPIGKPAELMGLWDGLRMMAQMRPYMKDFATLNDLTMGAFGGALQRSVLAHRHRQRHGG